MQSAMSPIIVGHLHLALVAWMEEEHPLKVEDRNVLIGACVLVAQALTAVIEDHVKWEEIDYSDFATHIPHYWSDRTGLIGHELTQSLVNVVVKVAEHVAVGEDSQPIDVEAFVFEYLEAAQVPHRQRGEAA